MAFNINTNFKKLFQKFFLDYTLTKGRDYNKIVNRQKPQQNN